MNLSSSRRAAIAVVEATLKSEQRNQLRFHFEVNSNRKYKDESGGTTCMIMIKIVDGAHCIYSAIVTLMASQLEAPLEWSTASVFFQTETHFALPLDKRLPFFVQAYSARWSGQEWLVEAMTHSA